MFIARSLVFYPGYFEDDCQELSDEIIIPAYHLNNIIEQFDDGEKLYVTMKNTTTDKSILVAIGSPHSYDKNIIFAPQWILDLIDSNGNDDTAIKITKADVSEIPAATKIVIKPLDPIAFELDTLACFEKAFMNLHSIKEGITVPIPVPELGTDYCMFAHIEKVEPESVSLIINGEVSVEFINDFKEDIIPSAPAPTPVEGSPIIGPMIPNSILNPVIMPLTRPSSPQISSEERRRIVRESWIKRCQNNVTRQ
jgi:hypothetical protein